MSPEQKFSNWLCKALRANGAFVQKLEVTTGRGVPDLFVAGNGRSHMIELKYDTEIIRPEQHVWCLKATEKGASAYCLVGYTSSIAVYSMINVKPMKKNYKLVGRLNKFPKTLEGVRSLMNYL